MRAWWGWSFLFREGGGRSRLPPACRPGAAEAAPTTHTPSEQVACCARLGRPAAWPAPLAMLAPGQGAKGGLRPSLLPGPARPQPRPAPPPPRPAHLSRRNSSRAAARAGEQRRALLWWRSISAACTPMSSSSRCAGAGRGEAGQGRVDRHKLGCTEHDKSLRKDPMSQNRQRSRAHLLLRDACVFSGAGGLCTCTNSHSGQRRAWWSGRGLAHAVLCCAVLRCAMLRCDVLTLKRWAMRGEVRPSANVPGCSPRRRAVSPGAQPGRASRNLQGEGKNYFGLCSAPYSTLQRGGKAHQSRGDGARHFNCALILWISRHIHSQLFGWPRPGGLTAVDAWWRKAVRLD